MKYLYFSFVIVFLNSCSSNNEQTSIIIDYWTTQEELNKLNSDLQNVTEFEGDITIGFDISDLESLQNIERINGKLIFQNSNIEVLTLSSLNVVNELEIRGNKKLRNVNLPRLEKISNNLLITGNSDLEEVDLNYLREITNYGIDIIDNELLKIIQMLNLKNYSILNFRLNPFLNQVTIEESISERCEKVLMDFDFINSNSILFGISENSCEVTIEVKKPFDSNVMWLNNLNGDNILNNTTLIGDFEIEQFCFLKDKIEQMNHPFNFQIKKSMYESKFDGNQIIQDCN